MTIGGNLLNYNGNTKAPTADITTMIFIIITKTSNPQNHTSTNATLALKLISPQKKLNLVIPMWSSTQKQVN